MSGVCSFSEIVAIHIFLHSTNKLKKDTFPPYLGHVFSLHRLTFVFFLNITWYYFTYRRDIILVSILVTIFSVVVMEVHELEFYKN